MSSALSKTYRRPSQAFRRQATLTLIYTTLLVGSAIYLGFDPLQFFREFAHVEDVIDRAFPPNLPLLWQRPRLFSSLGETLSLAFLGTFIGGLIALVLSFLAAANTTPHPSVRFTLRTLLAFQRSIPTFVIMLVMQVAVGIGPFSAAIALCLTSVGMFGKLFADAIEAIDSGPIESLAAIGGSRLQQLRYAVLPAAAPSIVAHWLYAYDINLRMAIALGVFGGGGIGFELFMSQKLLRHADMLAIVLLILVLIVATERISDLLRRRILGADQLATV